MNIFAVLCVFVGGGIGASLRFFMSFLLNPLVPLIPLGTLASNLLGGYLAGMAATFFLLRVDLPEHYRLLAITGFLGGLTTFSSFSIELMTLLQGGRSGVALASAALHLFGSLALTFLGAWTMRSLMS